MNLNKLYKVEKPSDDLYVKIYNSMPNNIIVEDESNSLFWAVFTILFGTIAVPSYALAEMVMFSGLSDTLTIINTYVEGIK